ncbi:MAG: site-specific integrase [Pedobacter sp.]|nr:site-specific integrase [Pedobacter sp.]
MDSIENAIITCYRRFKNDRKEEPAIDALREMVKVERGFSVAEENKPLEFMAFIDAFIKDAEQGKHINLSNGKPVTIVTVRTYKQTYKLLLAFELRTKRKLTFKDITPMFHKQFIHFIRQEFKSIETGKSLSINTAGKHITNIKTFMGVAYERKLTTSLDFRMKSFKVISEMVDKIYLTADEIQALHDHDFSANKRLERVRDIFVLGCYTGLRISDLRSLSNEHLVTEDGVLMIKLEMKKTEKPVAIWIDEKALQILNRYKAETGSYFPKPISEQKINAYIKEACAKIDLLQKEIIITATENNERVGKRIPKCTLVATHTMRRSFATNAALEGIPYNAIMPITGHRTERSFLRYIKLDQLDAVKIFKSFRERGQLKAV